MQAISGGLTENPLGLRKARKPWQKGISLEVRSPALKRFFDFTVALLALVVLAVPMAVIAVWVRLRLGSPVLFVQERPGRYGRPFRMVKFRTMTQAQDDSGRLLPDADRLPPAGRFLRSTSLDELPELFNVLKGDMALVGPRPLLMAYLPRYSPEQARRHEVRPGITGWAQVNGRNAVDWPTRLKLDVWYVDHWTLGLDLYILWRTILTVLRRSGVSAEGHATMPEFTGEEG